MHEEMDTWLDALVNATQSAVNKVIWFTPNLVVALLLLLLGTILGRWVGKFVETVLGKLKFSDFAKELKADRFVTPFGLNSPQQLIGKLSHLFVFLITLIAAADILHLPQVTGLIQTVLLYIPKAVVALLILFVGLWGTKISDGFLKGELLQRVPALKGLIRFLIVTFALLAALDQFQVSPQMIQILFAGLVFAMALAGGLAFGLGGKEAARDLLDHLKSRKR